MKKAIAVALPLLILSAASFAQNLPKPSLKSIIAAEEASDVNPVSTSAVAAEKASTADPAPTTAVAEAPQSYRLAVSFEENSLDLAPLSAAALDSMSVLFALHNRNRYEVHGYSCPTIPGQKVIRLSLQRVERIVEHLTALGGLFLAVIMSRKVFII